MGLAFLSLPTNMKKFLWLVAHNSLPTNLFRQIRHLSFDDSCNRCGGAQETLLRVLRDYAKALIIWNNMHFDLSRDFPNEVKVDWLQRYAHDSQHDALFSVVCWNIWKARNTKIFQDKVLRIGLEVNNIHHLHKEVLHAFTPTMNLFESFDIR